MRGEKKTRRVILISFSTHTKKFRSLGERNQFFRELYGWKQVVTKSNRQYSYERSGLLDNVPHIKIDDSVFIIAEKYLNKVKNYFNEWDKKVDYRIMKFLLEEKKMLKRMEELEKEIRNGV